MLRFADLVDRPHTRTDERQELYRALGRATHGRGFGIDVMNRVGRVTARVAAQWIRRLGTDLGLVVFVDVVASPEATLEEAHDMARRLERDIRQNRPEGSPRIVDVVVHTEP